MDFNSLKKLEAEETPYQNSKAWLVSLTDLISLLLAFFVMIYSTRDVSPEQFEQVKNSFTRYVYGDHLEKNYTFIERPSGETKIIKKSEALVYIESNLKNNFSPLDITIASTPKQVTAEFVADIPDIRGLETLDSLNNLLYQFSKVLNPISNQIEIMAEGIDNQSDLKISQYIAAKIEELGHEHVVMLTLPENLEKRENKVKIRIIINSYESIF